MKSHISLLAHQLDREFNLNQYNIFTSSLKSNGDDNTFLYIKHVEHITFDLNNVVYIPFKYKNVPVVIIKNK